jgi:hypothetical protein
MEIDPGHRYAVKNYDGAGYQDIQFMKRIGEMYPGNTGVPVPGTNCQDGIRVWCFRVRYLNGQVPCEENEIILEHFRESLLLFEFRAAKRHHKEKEWQDFIYKQNMLVRKSSIPVEEWPYCNKCGHMLCVCNERP